MRIGVSRVVALLVELGCGIGQRSTASAAENTHDAKTNIEQGQRIGHKPPHALHPSDSTEHAACAVCAPHDGGCGENNARGRIHGHDNSEEACEHEWEEAVSENGGGSGKCERCREMTSWLIGSLSWSFIILRMVGFGGGFRRRHERQDHVQRDGSQQG